MFAHALTLFAGREYGQAERAFSALSTNEDDAAVAMMSKEMLAMTLLYEQKWSTLRDLSYRWKLSAADIQNIPALQWGRAFAEVEPTTINFSDRAATLPLQITSVGTPTIRILINGKEFQFWLDTGSSMTVVSSRVAAEAGIAVIGSDRLVVSTFAGAAPVRPAVLTTLELGPIFLTNSPAIVMDAQLMHIKGSRSDLGESLTVDGIIGWDIIRQLDLTMNYRESTITLRRPRRMRVRPSSQNLTWVGTPLVTVRAKSGRDMHFTLDTGAQASFVDGGVLEITGTSSTYSNTRTYGIAQQGGNKARVVKGLNLEINGRSLPTKELIVYDQPSSGPVTCDGILGSDLAQFGTIRIDASNGLFSID
jgi:predicted aspartyl protease